MTFQKKTKLKIAIIGAGWFGCHIGLELLKKGYSIKIYEKENDIFKGASGNNQNRLHLGYHYPRSYITREQSKAGFKKFILKYKFFTKKVKKNFYAIADSKKSILDFKTYLQILKSSKLKYKILPIKKTNLRNVTGVINSEEMQIDHLKAKSFFRKKLKSKIILNKFIKNLDKRNNKLLIDNEIFDFVINCSWEQALNKNDKWEIIYEPVLTMLYKSKEQRSAITIMDGPFFTIYPWSKNYFHIYAVKESRLKKCKDINSARNVLKNISNYQKVKKKHIIEDMILHYYPNFKKKFKFHKFLTTIRTIQNSETHSRECKLSFNKRIVNVLSGKIDHVCAATEEIELWLKKYL